jgi:hypothetical protein
MEPLKHGETETIAIEALQRFREGSGSPEGDCLVNRADALDRLLPHERRREELLERAGADGMERHFAELIHEVALDVGLEPAFAYELVRCGVGVQPLDEQVYGEDDVDEEEMVSSEPPDELLVPDERDPVVAARERRLRVSFRRLRRHLEAQSSAEAALRAFTSEPDVGRLEY